MTNTGNTPAHTGGSIEQVVALILAQFRNRQRTDYGLLMQLQVIGLISEADVRDITSAVTFDRPGMHVPGRIIAGRWVEEVAG